MPHFKPIRSQEPLDEVSKEKYIGSFATIIPTGGAKNKQTNQTKQQKNKQKQQQQQHNNKTKQNKQKTNEQKQKQKQKNATVLMYRIKHQTQNVIFYFWYFNITFQEWIISISIVHEAHK